VYQSNIINQCFTADRHSRRIAD